MALLDTLATELLGPKSIGELSKSTGADSAQVKDLVAKSLPLLLSGMYQNSTTEDGAQSLAKALDDHAPAAEKSTSAMLRKADIKDGKKIVKHILGSQEKEITKDLAKSTGLTNTQVTTSLAQLAPVVLSLVGNHKQEQQQTQSASPGLAGLLGSALLGNGFQQVQSSNNQGGINLTNLAGSLLGGSASQSAGGSSLAGSLLGNILGGSSASQPAQQQTQQQSGGINLSGLLLNILK